MKPIHQHETPVGIAVSITILTRKTKIPCLCTMPGSASDTMLASNLRRAVKLVMVMALMMLGATQSNA